MYTIRICDSSSDYNTDSYIAKIGDPCESNEDDHPTHSGETYIVGSSDDTSDDNIVGDNTSDYHTNYYIAESGDHTIIFTIRISDYTSDSYIANNESLVAKSGISENYTGGLASVFCEYRCKIAIFYISENYIEEVARSLIWDMKSGDTVAKFALCGDCPRKMTIANYDGSISQELDRIGFSSHKIRIQKKQTHLRKLEIPEDGHFDNDDMYDRTDHLEYKTSSVDRARLLCYSTSFNERIRRGENNTNPFADDFRETNFNFPFNRSTSMEIQTFTTMQHLVDRHDGYFRLSYKIYIITIADGLYIIKLNGSYQGSRIQNVVYQVSPLRIAVLSYEDAKAEAISSGNDAKADNLPTFLRNDDTNYTYASEEIRELQFPR